MEFVEWFIPNLCEVPIITNFGDDNKGLNRDQSGVFMANRDTASVPKCFLVIFLDECSRHFTAINLMSLVFTMISRSLTNLAINSYFAPNNKLDYEVTRIIETFEWSL